MRIMSASAYDFDILAMWETRMPERHERTEFVTLLNWPDEPTMRDAWARFRADEEWKEIKRVMSAHAQRGDLVGEIEDRVLVLTGYSPSARLSKRGEFEP